MSQSLLFGLYYYIVRRGRRDTRNKKMDWIDFVNNAAESVTNNNNDDDNDNNNNGRRGNVARRWRQEDDVAGGRINLQ